jgi:uncharacterized membrane protein YGL010W
MSQKNLFDENGKKYVINEGRIDFFGRKKFTVTESKTSNSKGFGNLILVLIFIALLTLPAGNLSLVLYVLICEIAVKNYTGNRIQNFKENLAWVSIGVSIVFVGFYYYKFWDNLSSELVINSCISGLFCYYILYEVVSWSQRSEEKKRKIILNIIIYALSIIGVIFYNHYYENQNVKINKVKKRYINSEKSKNEVEEIYNKNWLNK